MKTLCLLRHAKSRSAEAGIPDSGRTLNRRGRDAACWTGRYMADRGLAPDLALCSPAARTRETLALVLSETGWSPPTEYPPELYPGEPDRVIECIRLTEETVRALLVIGHNPGLHRLAWDLSRPEESEDRRRLGAEFPTAALAVLQFQTSSWAGIRIGEATLADFVTPKRPGRD